MRRLLIVAAILVAQSIPAVAQSSDKDLDRWVERDLVPYVRQQLVGEPRFANETVMFVVLRDNAPVSSSNALALAIRDRMLAAAIATPDITISWQQGRGAADTPPKDCLRKDVRYYVGVELTQKLDGEYAVSVRALDLERHTWVAGFGKHWQGSLSTGQRQALRLERLDPTFRGGRELPFTLAQTDLMAARLAYELSCALPAHGNSDYVVALEFEDAAIPGLNGTIDLVGRNLASRQALTLSGDRDNTNATLSARAYRIDGSLHQYWVTLAPNRGAGSLAALSASAYIMLPEAERKATPATSSGRQASAKPLFIPSAGEDALLGSLSVAPLESTTDCRAKPCAQLETRAAADAVVFFLAHDVERGLTRLGNADCSKRTAARVARRGDTLRVVLAQTPANSNWTETHEWKAAPDADTYYALAVADTAVARRLANHLDRLPPRCSGSSRPGLQGHALANWLDELAMLTARVAHVVDWRGLSRR